MNELGIISIIIPIYNEEESIQELGEQICEVAEQENFLIEVIMVDDGSLDGSWNQIKSICEKDNRFKGIRFRKNYGKAAALAAANTAAAGSIVIQLDGDLQDDPSEIPLLIAELKSGYDIINGWKKKRYDPWHKVWPSKVFNFITSKLTGLKLHDHNCGFKCLRAEVSKNINLYGELHRFIPAIAHMKGYRVKEAVVNHRPRKFGKSKFGVNRFMRGFLDLLTVRFLQGYGWRPQHFLGGIGMISFLLGSGGLTYLFFRWCFGYRPVGTPLVVSYSIAAVSVGINLIALGFLAELILAKNLSKNENYSIIEYS